MLINIIDWLLFGSATWFFILIIATGLWIWSSYDYKEAVAEEERKELEEAGYTVISAEEARTLKNRNKILNREEIYVRGGKRVV